MKRQGWAGSVYGVVGDFSRRFLVVSADETRELFSPAALSVAKSEHILHGTEKASPCTQSFSLPSFKTLLQNGEVYENDKKEDYNRKQK